MLSPSLFESTSFLTVLVPPDREADTFSYDPADLLAIVEDFERYTQGEDANEAASVLMRFIDGVRKLPEFIYPDALVDRLAAHQEANRVVSPTSWDAFVIDYGYYTRVYAVKEFFVQFEALNDRESELIAHRGIIGKQLKAGELSDAEALRGRNLINNEMNWLLPRRSALISAHSRVQADGE